MKQLLEMKDSDGDYELWMKELEVEREKREIWYTHPDYEHPLSKQDLINKCFYISLIGLAKIHHENFLKATQYFSSYIP